MLDPRRRGERTQARRHLQRYCLVPVIFVKGLSLQAAPRSPTIIPLSWVNTQAVITIERAHLPCIVLWPEAFLEWAAMQVPFVVLRKPQSIGERNVQEAGRKGEFMMIARHPLTL